MTEKRYKCHLASVGVHIGVGTEEHELTGDECRDLLNELSTENRQLKLQNKKYSMMVNANHDLNDEIYGQLTKIEKEYKSILAENEELKQELFESEKEWYECNYADNPVRLDSKLEALKEEFKERFGRDFE